MKEYKTVSKVAGPLLFVEKTEPVSYEEQVSLVLPDGTLKRGQVLDTSEDLVVVQCFETTTGLGRDTGVRFLGETFKMPVSKSMLGRILSGGGKPIDGGPDIVPDKRLDINGAAINPYARGSPRDFFRPVIRPSTEPTHWSVVRSFRSSPPQVLRPTKLHCRSPVRPKCPDPRKSSLWCLLQWVSPVKKQTTSWQTSRELVHLSVLSCS